MSTEKPFEKTNAADPAPHTDNPVARNVSHLRALFPEAVSEGQVDFEVLKQLLGGAVDECEERFGLNWTGKRQSRQLALTPSTGTLLPCPEESVDWETTQNVIIEGDNLEVLKLLQKAYSGKVKFIYIDPPYNTGNDFIYPDNYRDSLKSYLDFTSQRDSDGNRLSSNTESSGRFHTTWLNMIYPRLLLARTLLREDGIVFISIDDNEVSHLRMLCDEVFGPENRIEEVAWKNKYGSGALTKGFANVHEYILVYSRTPISNLAAPLDEEQKKAYRLKDAKFAVRGGYITQPLATTSKDDRPNLRYPIIHDGDEIWPEKQWVWEKERFDRANRDGDVVINKTHGKYSVRIKQYLRDENGVERLGKPVSIMNGPFNQDGTREIRELFGASVFDFPKPSALVQKLFSMVVNDRTEDDGLHLDFFAGSCSAAHAVLALNAADAGRRRFIMVQLPEPCRTTSKAYEYGLKTIADIGKERVRRAGRQIEREHARGDVERDVENSRIMEAGDVGFRVFKLDASNLRRWRGDRERIGQSLLEHVENVRSDRSEEDILHEVILKLGLDLCTPVETRVIAGKVVHAVGDGRLIACLDALIGYEHFEALGQEIVAWRSRMGAVDESTVVFRDSAFADDVVKANMAAMLQQNGFRHIRAV